MPREDRRILFTNDEVYKAIYSLAYQKNMPRLPTGELLNVEQKETDETQCVVHLKLADTGEGATYEYSRDFIAAALMIFCRGSGIPLPKKARKSVMFKDKQVLLRAEI